MDSIKKIILTNLNHSIRNIIIPPIGLGYLSAAVKKYSNWDVEILDALNQNLSNKEVIDRIIKGGPKVAGFSTTSRDHCNLIEVCSGIKKKNPHMVIVVGGPHPSGIPDVLLDLVPQIDYVIQGEGEFPLVELLKLIENNKVNQEKIDGLAYRKENKIIVNPVKLKSDINIIPMPDWELINPNSYPLLPHGAISRKMPTDPIIPTRGCPYNCIY